MFERSVVYMTAQRCQRYSKLLWRFENNKQNCVALQNIGCNLGKFRTVARCTRRRTYLKELPLCTAQKSPRDYILLQVKVCETWAAFSTVTDAARQSMWSYVKSDQKRRLNYLMITNDSTWYFFVLEPCWSQRSWSFHTQSTSEVFAYHNIATAFLIFGRSTSQSSLRFIAIKDERQETSDTVIVGKSIPTPTVVRGTYRSGCLPQATCLSLHHQWLKQNSFP